jgi:hypothetical protein
MVLVIVALAACFVPDRGHSRFPCLGSEIPGKNLGDGGDLFAPPPANVRSISPLVADVPLRTHLESRENDCGAVPCGGVRETSLILPLIKLEDLMSSAHVNNSVLDHTGLTAKDIQLAGFRERFIHPGRLVLTDIDQL